MGIKDVTDIYVIDGKVNIEALKKDYPEDFVKEILYRMQTEEIMKTMGIEKEVEVKKAIIDKIDTLVLVTAQNIFRFVWIKDYQKTSTSYIPIETAKYIKEWI